MVLLLQFTELRAANGVVLITTKHGKKGKTRVDIRQFCITDSI